MEARDLITRCIKGNAQAQKQLYDMYSSKMLSICYRYGKNPFDAKDIFQEGFLKIFENLHQLKDPDALEWWMKRIFINEAYKLYNKNEHVYLVEDASEYMEDKFDYSDVFSKIGTEVITKIIQALPHKMRLVFNMYIIEGYSHKEISEILNISEGTSKSNLHDARNVVKRKLAALEQIRSIG